MRNLSAKDILGLQEKITDLEAKNEALRLEIEEKDRIHQEKIDVLIAQHMLDMRARFGRKTERFVDAESPQENLFPNMESEDPTTKDTAPEDIENIVYTGGKAFRVTQKSAVEHERPETNPVFQSVRISFLCQKQNVPVAAVGKRKK